MPRGRHHFSLGPEAHKAPAVMAVTCARVPGAWGCPWMARSCAVREFLSGQGSSAQLGPKVEGLWGWVS